MSWNNGYERSKFEARQKKQAEEYRALGMTEEQIKTMYEFDLEQFNSDRRYLIHTQSLQLKNLKRTMQTNQTILCLKIFLMHLQVELKIRAISRVIGGLNKLIIPNLLHPLKV